MDITHLLTVPLTTAARTARRGGYRNSESGGLEKGRDPSQENTFKFQVTKDAVTGKAGSRCGHLKMLCT